MHRSSHRPGPLSPRVACWSLKIAARATKTWGKRLHQLPKDHHFSGCCSDMHEPIERRKRDSPISQSKTQTGITESRGITSETGTHGQPSSHLTKSSHNEENDEADESVADEDGAGAGLGERLTGTNDQTSTNGTTNGNHGNVASLESTVQRSVGRSLETANVASHIVACAGVVCRLFGIVVRRRLVGGR